VKTCGLQDLGCSLQVCSVVPTHAPRCLQRLHLCHSKLMQVLLLVGCLQLGSSSLLLAQL
jgi:hypothetical protein